MEEEVNGRQPVQQDITALEEEVTQDHKDIQQCEETSGIRREPDETSCPIHTKIVRLLYSSRQLVAAKTVSA